MKSMLIPLNDAIFFSPDQGGLSLLEGMRVANCVTFPILAIAFHKALHAQQECGCRHFSRKTGNALVIHTLSYHLTRGFVLAIVHEDESESELATSRTSSGNRRTF